MKSTSAAISILTVALLFLSGTIIFAQGDLKDHRSCSICGMDRKEYGFSRMLVHYEDGGTTGVCSLNCAVIELAVNKGRKVKALFVADRDSRTLIDAEQAVWVMGGKKPGVMTQRPKWAFGSPSAAGAFIAAYGGKIVPWSEALAAAREDAARDLR
jgi:nitrous oxide reductase accessory protein NosL